MRDTSMVTAYRARQVVRDGINKKLESPLSRLYSRARDVAGELAVIGIGSRLGATTRFSYPEVSLLATEDMLEMELSQAMEVFDE